MKFFVLSLLCATAALAQQPAATPDPAIKTTFSNTDTLRVKEPYSKVASGNVVVKGEIDSGSTSGHQVFLEKNLTVDISGNHLGTCTVEACIVTQKDNNKTQFPLLSWAAGQATMSALDGHFVFILSCPTTFTDYKGWFVRVFNKGKVVGLAGSSEAMETLAADPALKVRYTQLTEPPKKKKPKK